MLLYRIGNELFFTFRDGIERTNFRVYDGSAGEPNKFYALKLCYDNDIKHCIFSLIIFREGNILVNIGKVDQIEHNQWLSHNTGNRSNPIDCRRASRAQVIELLLNFDEIC